MGASCPDAGRGTGAAGRGERVWRKMIGELAPLRALDAVGAGRTVSLHVPGELDAPGMRGLARHAAAKVREVRQESSPPHFLLAGPNGLATLIGAGSNANGPVLVPFWDGHAYVSPLVIGS